MSVRERGNYEGVIHHIWQRGNNKEFVFQNDITKGFLIKQLKDYNKKFDYNLLAYVIMDNHYHLLIQTNKDPIGEVMFNINNVTGKFIRDILKRSGHIFQGRYCSNLVQTNEYLLWLLRYIHRNPVRSGICKEVGDYKWSSYRCYLKGHSDFINVSFPLSIFSPDKKIATRLFWRLMNSDGLEESREKDFEFFSPQLSQYNNQENCDINLQLPSRSSITDIVNSLGLPDKDILLLTSGSRKRSLTNIKTTLIKKAIGEKYTLSEIAAYLNITQSAVSKLLSF